MLGWEPVLGRLFLTDDDHLDGISVALISYSYWQDYYGGRSDILGETIVPRRSAPLTIVGVLSPTAQMPLDSVASPALPLPVERHEVWTVLHLTPADLSGQRAYEAIALLREGTSLEAVNVELQQLSLQGGAPPRGVNTYPRATPLLDEVLGAVGRVVWIACAAMVSALLIGLANLISMQMVRNSARKRDAAIRAALGASRRQLVGQLLVESVSLSLAGGLFGLILAWIGTRFVVGMLPPGIPRVDEVAPDVGVLAFAVTVSMGLGALVGSIPGWYLTKGELSASINEGATTATGGPSRGRLQQLLVGFETAIVLVLLVGSGLFLNSLWHLLSEDAGVQNERSLWSATVRLPLSYSTTDALSFWERTRQSIGAVPEVESVAVSYGPGPLSGFDVLLGGIIPADSIQDHNEPLVISNRAVGAGYFETLAIPMLRGRSIQDADVTNSERVVILNEAAAEALWPGEDPIGRILVSGRERLNVVGLVRNFKHMRLDGEVAPQMYLAGALLHGSYRRMPYHRVFQHRG